MNANEIFRKGLKPTDACPCGSGREYQDCHLASDSISSRPFRLKKVVPTPEVLAAFERAEGKEQLRKDLQGLGKPIISAQMADYRFVVVGNELYHSKDYKTFHDFLFEYIKRKIGPEWGRAQISLPPERQHPLMLLYRRLCELQQRSSTKQGEIYSAPMTGSAAAYIHLAYGLYNLEHNAEIQELLLKRLRNEDGFWPAFYETLVVSAFVLAGFDVAIENESDSTVDHSEFIATSKKTGKKYSVEAKWRRPGKTHANITKQLYKALAKDLPYERIVCVEVNLPHVDAAPGQLPSPLKEAMDSVDRVASTMTIRGKPVPPAYVLVTNHPWMYSLDGPGTGSSWGLMGFKKKCFECRTLKEYWRDREEHSDLYDLRDSLNKHRDVPVSFDAEIPEFAFDSSPIPRLEIGRRYEVPTESGVAVGILEDAAVLENEQMAYGAYRLDDGRRILASNPLTDAELAAYRRRPEHFFGVYRPQPDMNDPGSIQQWLLGTYGQSTKEQLLGFMSAWPNQVEIAALSQRDLAQLYTRHMAGVMMQRAVSDRQRHS